MASKSVHADKTTRYSFLDDEALRQSSPKQILSSMFSTKCYISPAWSAMAIGGRRDGKEHQLEAVKQIGKGQCGQILALSGTSMVLKIPNDHKLEQLWNDCRMHKRVEEAFQKTAWDYRNGINIPTFGSWIHPSSATVWASFAEYSRGFSAYALMTEKILPLPLPVRMAIVEAFAPRSVKKDKEAFLSQDENKDCLVRLYLGRREQRSSSKAFRLRNFDLTVGEMAHLGLDIMMYARVMAQSLAIMHWKARIDADDVEFVLGIAPKIKKAATAAELDAMSYDDTGFSDQSVDLAQRSVGIWLLDFNQCRTFSDDGAGIKQLERAFFFNDPYYPRPGMENAEDEALWEHFKQTYLETSGHFVTSDMPKRFVEAVESEGRKRTSVGSLFQ